MHDGAEIGCFIILLDSVHLSQRIDSIQYILFYYLFYYHKFNFLLLLNVFSITILFLVKLRNCHIEIQIVGILSSWGS